MDQLTPDQPGDPDQLAETVQDAERAYERAQTAIVVFWDQAVKRYRFIHGILYKRTAETIEVLWIPK